MFRMQMRSPRVELVLAIVSWQMGHVQVELVLLVQGSVSFFKKAVRGEYSIFFSFGGYL